MKMNAALTAFSTKILATGLIAASLLLSQNASAEAKEVPNYTIEVIVFENHALKGWTEELWADEIVLPDAELAIPISNRGVGPLWILMQNNNLDTVAQKMQRDYRILFHKTWSQNAFAPSETPLVLIESDSTQDTNVLGTVKLYKTRFAHVQFDLEIEKRIPSAVQVAFAENQLVTLDDLPSHWRFILKESRKIKPGELHYIDHPLFGVLVQIHKNN